MSAAVGDGVVALAGVVGAVCGNARNLFFCRDLAEQTGQTGASPMWFPVISTARISSVFSSIPRWTLRQTRRLELPCLRACHSPSPSAAASRPSHRQRATLPQRLVVGRPVPGLVARRYVSAHGRQLPRWIHERNPLPDLRNKAARRARRRREGRESRGPCMERKLGIQLDERPLVTTRVTPASGACRAG